MSSLENWIYPGFLDHILDLSFGCIPTLLKSHAGGHLPYSNIKTFNRVAKFQDPTTLILSKNSSIDHILYYSLNIFA